MAAFFSLCCNNGGPAHVFKEHEYPGKGRDNEVYVCVRGCMRA